MAEEAAPEQSQQTADAGMSKRKASRPQTTGTRASEEDVDELPRRVEAIIAEAHSSVKRENKRAAELMWALSSGGPTETTESLVTRGAIEACIHLVSAGADAYIRRCALTAIANLLNVDERSRSMVLDEGGLEHLLEAFRSPRDPEMQKCALRCIMTLSKHLETRVLLFAEKDFVNVLMGLAANPRDGASAYFLAATLDTVTRKEEFAMKIVAHENIEGDKDVLKCLLKLADTNAYPEDVVAEAVRAMYNLTVCVENATAANNELRAMLEEDLTMDVLRALAAPTKTIEIRCVAADTLAILTNNRDRIAELQAEFGLNFSYGQAELTEEVKDVEEQ